VKIQLLTFPGCPNAAAARELLRSVVASSGIPAAIEEVDTSAPETPEPLRGWGSPTILIDGGDAGGEESPDRTGCRLYRDERGRLRGTPSEELLRAALFRTSRGDRDGLHGRVDSR